MSTHFYAKGQKEYSKHLHRSSNFFTTVVGEREEKTGMTLEFMPEDNTIIQVPLPSTIMIHFVIFSQYSSLTYKHILMSFSDFKRNENL